MEMLSIISHEGDQLDVEGEATRQLQRALSELHLEIFEYENQATNPVGSSGPARRRTRREEAYAGAIPEDRQRFRPVAQQAAEWARHRPHLWLRGRQVASESPPFTQLPAPPAAPTSRTQQHASQAVAPSQGTRIGAAPHHGPSAAPPSFAADSAAARAAAGGGPCSNRSAGGEGSRRAATGGGSGGNHGDSAVCDDVGRGLVLQGRRLPISALLPGMEPQEEILACHGILEETIAVQYDQLEVAAAAATAAGGRAGRRPGRGSEARGAAEGLPPVEPRAALLHEIAEQLLPSVWRRLAPLLAPLLARLAARRAAGPPSAADDAEAAFRGSTARSCGGRGGGLAQAQVATFSSDEELQEPYEGRGPDSGGAAGRSIASSPATSLHRKLQPCNGQHQSRPATPQRQHQPGAPAAEATVQLRSPLGPPPVLPQDHQPPYPQPKPHPPLTRKASLLQLLAPGPLRVASGSMALLPLGQPAAVHVPACSGACGGMSAAYVPGPLLLAPLHGAHVPLGQHPAAPGLTGGAVTHGSSVPHQQQLPRHAPSLEWADVAALRAPLAPHALVVPVGGGGGGLLEVSGATPAGAGAAAGSRSLDGRSCLGECAPGASGGSGGGSKGARAGRGGSSSTIGAPPAPAHPHAGGPQSGSASPVAPLAHHSRFLFPQPAPAPAAAAAAASAPLGPSATSFSQVPLGLGPGQPLVPASGPGAGALAGHAPGGAGRRPMGHVQLAPLAAPVTGGSSSGGGGAALLPVAGSPTDAMAKQAATGAPLGFAGGAGGARKAQSLGPAAAALQVQEGLGRGPVSSKRLPALPKAAMGTGEAWGVNGR